MNGEINTTFGSPYITGLSTPLFSILVINIILSTYAVHGNMSTGCTCMVLYPNWRSIFKSFAMIVVSQEM